MDYSDGHLRTVAGKDDRGPGFQNNEFRVHGACFGVIVGVGSVPGGKSIIVLLEQNGRSFDNFVYLYVHTYTQLGCASV